MLEILHPVLLNILGRQSAGIWTLTLEKGCRTLGHVGLVRTAGVWVDEWVETGLDVFSVIVPDWAGASSRLPVFSVH